MNKAITSRPALMSFTRSLLVPPLASWGYSRIKAAQRNFFAQQENIFHSHLRVGRQTIFGEDHFFRDVNSYEEFKEAVPLRKYEDLKTYIDKIASGGENVLWKGRPIYFAKTSGTTSGAKYIPVTKESLRCQRAGRLYLMANYIGGLKKREVLRGNVLLFTEHHTFERKGNIPAAAISGILASTIPAFYKTNYLPSKETNLITDYNKKLDRIIDECRGRKITSMVSMPTWLLLFLDKLEARTGKRFSENFPGFKMLSVSGVNYAPYRDAIAQYIDKPFDQLETYPSSEGFIAYKDRLDDDGLALVPDQGIFFEFVPAAAVNKKDPVRCRTAEVKLNEEYAIVLSTNAGLWSYLLGDTVRFTSLDPPRIVITGRITQYLSAFAEGMKQADIERCLYETAGEFSVKVLEYLAAPVFSGSLPHYEWLIEFDRAFDRVSGFARVLNEKLRVMNYSYAELLDARAIAPLVVNAVRKNAFYDFAASKGKQGGQNKPVRFYNDDKILDELKKFLTN